MCVLLFMCTSEEGGGWKWGLLLMPQCNHRTSERQRRTKWYLRLCGTPPVDIIHLYIPYYHMGPFGWRMKDGKKKIRKGRDRGRRRRRGGWEGGAATRGADGIGKMRGKREGETDILETGRASAGAARLMN